MDLNRIYGFLADVAPTGSTVPNPQAEMIKTVLMLGAFGLMFYFVLIRPQQKKAKEQANLLKAMKPGDRIMTSSGIIGVVVTLKDKTATIRSADTKLEISKAAITEITERSEASPES